MSFHRQQHGDEGAAPRRVLHLELARVPRDNLVADGEAYAAAPLFPPALIEALLHVRQVLGGDAGAVVAHAYAHVFALLDAGDLDAAAAAAVFGGVVEYVQHDLLEAARVRGLETCAALVSRIGMESVCAE